MHLRRALLLFALVLGLAALAALLSPPGRKREDRTPVAPGEGLPELSPGPSAGGPARLRFSDEGKPERRSLRAGRPAVVTVRVGEPGQVELDGLGLSAPAEPLTPARFDVLTDRLGRYRVRFTAAGRTRAETVGVLRVVGPPT